ncbi:MAG: tRNA-2-methylthio-N6-dimethylallyladenosine synthase, partial [Solirubrobacteraceae bacterium]|nr:tRNA-2-methylthio-N6-dimethylallyladenosine synthase [Solirubrobacteraceae bacterium]
MRYHLTTFGCQMNVHDSERMKGMLESIGYEEAPDQEDADLILFNTCSIRERADTRFLAHLGHAKRLKALHPERIVGVGGCWAQSVKEEIFSRFPFVDVAFGPGQVHKLAEFLVSDSLTSQGFFEFEGFTGRLPAKRDRPFQAWMQISVGCNSVCSYCIVPSTRGREVSRPPGELVAEAERLAADGVREVTLLGQNVNSYGRDLTGPDRMSFAGLLERIDRVEGIERIRYTSPHPKDMREDVIRAHANLGSVCEHIHLPLQSGSSGILKAMRRTYTRERYLDRVAQIREHVPDCALTTDIIVGFPGETEEDFAETVAVVEAVGYDGAFTFVYSPRRGTEAGRLTEGLVAHEVKVERMERLVEVVQRRAHARAQRFVGRTVE